MFLKGIVSKQFFFRLWTDFLEIWYLCKKFDGETFFFVFFFFFDSAFSFQNNRQLSVFTGDFLLFKKNRSHEPVTLEKKQGRFSNSWIIPNKTRNRDFSILLLFYFDLQFYINISNSKILNNTEIFMLEAN